MTVTALEAPAGLAADLDTGQQALDIVRAALPLIPAGEFAFAAFKVDFHVYSQETVDAIAASPEWDVKAEWSEDGTQYRAEKRFSFCSHVTAIYIPPKTKAVPAQADPEMETAA